MLNQSGDKIIQTGVTQGLASIEFPGKLFSSSLSLIFVCFFLFFFEFFSVLISRKKNLYIEYTSVYYFQLVELRSHAARFRKICIVSSDHIRLSHRASFLLRECKSICIAQHVQQQRLQPINLCYHNIKESKRMQFAGRRDQLQFAVIDIYQIVKLRFFL